MVSHRDLYLQFSMTNDVEPPFMCLLAIHISLLICPKFVSIFFFYLSACFLIILTVIYKFGKSSIFTLLTNVSPSLKLAFSFS